MFNIYPNGVMLASSDPIGNRDFKPIVKLPINTSQIIVDIEKTELKKII